jgi:hypothetical protein
MNSEVFDFRVNKDDRIFISWRGKLVTILKEWEAQKFLRKAEHLNNQKAQSVMAKTTGNFKRGNERG